MHDQTFSKLIQSDAATHLSRVSMFDGTDERIRGTDGPDRLVGTAGDDRISGGSGNDRIKGGNGNDALFGGSGRDVFIFDSTNEGRDRINDFTSVDHIRFQTDADEANGPRQYDDLTFSEVARGTLISYGDDGSKILLVGVTMDQIDQSQFIFL